MLMGDSTLKFNVTGVTITTPILADTPSMSRSFTMLDGAVIPRLGIGMSLIMSHSVLGQNFSPGHSYANADPLTSSEFSTLTRNLTHLHSDRQVG